MTDDVTEPSNELPTRESSPSLLLVDDDATLRERLGRALRERGYDVRTAANVEEAMASVRADSPELAVLDLRMPGGNGLELLRQMRELDPATRVLVLTGYGSIATAVEAIKLGAESYLPKPVDADELLAAFARGGGATPCPITSRRRPWPGPSGSTSTACSPTATATSARRRGGWASTAARCSASCRSIRPPGDHASSPPSAIPSSPRRSRRPRAASARRSPSPRATSRSPPRPATWGPGWC